MIKQLYFEPLFSNRREKLIEMCTEIQKQGKNFIYILPSREALGDVRTKLLEKLGGIFNSKIIMFDELEREITENYLLDKKLIYQDTERLLIKGICEAIKVDFKYFKSICTKNGFIEESLSFIKNLKRSCINDDVLFSLQSEVNDEILKDKLLDLQLVYKHYNNYLNENNLYDINDVSLLAADKASNFSELENVSVIIIDGFINIDKVNIELIKKISLLNKVDFYVNCPYLNSFTSNFLENEILNPFKNMGFEICYKSEEFYETKPQFKELSEKLYSGEKLEADPADIEIIKYPCIASEVRETARSIKEKLLNGAKIEDIAVFINNKDDYSSFLNSIFHEFQIPLFMNYEISLSDAKLSRDILIRLKNLDVEKANGEEWLEVLNEEVSVVSKEINKVVLKAFRADLGFNEKLCLKAFEGITKLINDIKVSFKTCGLMKSSINKQEFIDIFKQNLIDSTITVEAPNNSGVKILNTDLAKGVYYKHIYILGLNDGEIPKIIKNDGLFDELEVEKLKEVSIQYEDYLWELTREKIKFNLSLSSALESITLSYRSSGEDGKFAIPSSLLEEGKFVTGLELNKTITMRDRFNIPLNSVMSKYELTAASLKNVFEHKYRSNDDDIKEQVKEILNYEKNLFDFIKKGNIEYHREKEQDFNNFEGNISLINNEIIINKGSFSPSKISTYFNCPFSYMIQNIFGLQKISIEEEVYSSMEIGDFYHKVLNYYYNELQNFGVLDEGRFNLSVEAAWNEMRVLAISDFEKQQILEELTATVKNFIQCDLKRINNFEKESGNIIRPYILEEFIESDVFGVPIKCKIDRIDLEYSVKGGTLTPTGRFIVYDYKKNKTSDIDEMLGKENCQLIFYYYFAYEYLRKKLKTDNLDCMSLLYLSIEGTNKSVKKNGLYRSEFKKALGFTGANKFDMNKEIFYSFLEFLKGLILESIDSIKQGYFPYKLSCECFDEQSHSYCDYKDICRFSKNKMSILAEV